MKLEKTHEIHFFTTMLFGTLFLMLILSFMFSATLLFPKINWWSSALITTLSFAITFFILYKIRFRIWYFVFKRENKKSLNYKEFKAKVRKIEKSE